MPKSVVCGGETYFSQMVLASSSARARSSVARRLRDASASARSCGFRQALVLLLRELGVDRQPTGAPPSVVPGSLIANSTRALAARPRSPRSSRTGPTVSTCSSSMPSCTSPQVPRDFTLVSTRFRSPTPIASCCISPRPWCTFSSRSETSLNDSPRRCSSVACSFSSTVRRISSSRAPLSVCRSRIFASSVARTRPCAGRWIRSAWPASGSACRAKWRSAPACSSRPALACSVIAGASLRAAAHWLRRSWPAAGRRRRSGRSAASPRRSPARLCCAGTRPAGRPVPGACRGRWPAPRWRSSRSVRSLAFPARHRAGRVGRAPAPDAAAVAGIAAQR